MSEQLIVMEKSLLCLIARVSRKRTIIEVIVLISVKTKRPLLDFSTLKF